MTLLLLLVLALPLAGCVALTPEPTQPTAVAAAPSPTPLPTVAPSPESSPAGSPTPAPPTPTEAPSTPTPSPTLARETATPTVTATARAPLAVATPTAPPPQPTATPTRRTTPPRPTATPTPAWPQTLILREADIEAAAARNAVPGLQVQGLDVTLGSGGMVLTFASLRYGFVSLRNVTVQGSFAVANGDVNFVAERIQPRNPATSIIPGAINQALDNYLAAWYVESLRVEPGRLVAQVRPR
ncbi:MAG: hypothetical protein NZ528_15000 [Caldilineales bacterium]|nr:hypothetical protein [Caldilineales bacterium]